MKVFFLTFSFDFEISLNNKIKGKNSMLILKILILAILLNIDSVLWFLDF